MRSKNVNLGHGDILGRKALSPAPTVGAADVERWRLNLGLLSVIAGMATITSSQATAVQAKEADVPKPHRVPARLAALAKKLDAACSKPELLRRQSEYRLPGQKTEFNMVELLAGGDNCPGTAIPAGTYTAAAPFNDTGTTVGANNTVDMARVGTGPCIEGYYGVTYTSVQAPDHIYSFTLTARGANPRITVDGGGNYDVSTYILSGSGAGCPAGTGNTADNCLVGTDVNFNGNAEIINAAKMNSLPLNVPLYLFIDSFYPANTPTTSNTGTYTVAIQDVTISTGVQPPANDAYFDMNGDGKSDYVTVRSAGGPTGQLTWWTMFSANAPIPAPSEEQALAAPDDGAPTSTTDWGLASDFPVPADYDGDGKDDFAVWRPGTTGVFYIVRSQTATLFSEPFGQNGDDPTVVGDYTGDNRDDIAVYRGGATSSDPSTWFYRSIGSPPGVQSVPWGQGGDTPAPGDYDGDGRHDFVVQRPDSNGVNGRFWVRENDGPQYSQFFGLANDSVVTGDFDDDGKTDFAVVRNDNGAIRWDYEPSGTAGVTTVTDTWGVTATDVVVPADYDGDGRTEYAVWRPGSPGFFHVMTPVTRRIWAQSWGLTGDIAVANNNEH